MCGENPQCRNRCETSYIFHRLNLRAEAEGDLFSPKVSVGRIIQILALKSWLLRHGLIRWASKTWCSQGSQARKRKEKKMKGGREKKMCEGGKAQKKKPTQARNQPHLPRTGIEPVILSLLVIRFTTKPTRHFCEWGDIHLESLMLWLGAMRLLCVLGLRRAKKKKPRRETKTKKRCSRL